MKQVILLFICILILFSAGCRDAEVSDNDINTAAGNSKAANVQSNLGNCTRVIEYKDIIIFDDYLYDKTSSEISLLCKNPVCSHTEGFNSEDNDCILLKLIGSLQIYNDNILCTCSKASNNIYKLDPQTGTLSVFYKANMQVRAFRLYGDNNAVIHSDKGIYAVSLKTGESLELIKGDVYNSFYTSDDNYMYISLEDFTLHRISLDTGEDIVLKERGYAPTVYGGKVYYRYVSESEEEWTLMRMNPDGSDAEVIVNDVMGYSIYKDRIYYYTASYPKKSMICDTDGKNNKEILNESADFYILPEAEKVISRAHKDFSYRIMDLDGSNIEGLAVPQ